MTYHHDHNHKHSEDEKIEYLKFAVIIFLIGVAALYLQGLFGEGGVIDYLRYFMGVFFMTFATFKFWNLEDFPAMFAKYDVIASKYIAYGYAYPVIQMILGGMYLAGTGSTTRDFIAFAVSSVSAYGVINALYIKKQKIECACLGNVIKLPLSKVTLIEDVGMAAMAFLVIVF